MSQDKQSLEPESTQAPEATPVKKKAEDEVAIRTDIPKYLVLANSMFWRDPGTGFELSWTTQAQEHTLRDLDPKSLKAMAEAEKNPPEEPDPAKGNWWIAVADIPNDQNLLRMLNRAVAIGKMELTDNYKQWLIDKKEVRASAKRKRKGLVWAELDIPKVQERQQMPRNPSIAKGTMAYSDKNSKAYQILQEASQDLKKLLPKVVGALPEKERPAFLKEALEIERAGYNRAAAPRVAVVDMVVDLMRDHGISSGIGMVTSEQEPITKDVKPLKIPM